MPATKSKTKQDEQVEQTRSTDSRNAIFHADALKALGDLPAGHVDLTVFSPPYDGIRDYGKNWTLDYKTLGSELYRATTDGGMCAVVIGDDTKDFAKSLTNQHGSGSLVHA